MAIQQEVQPVGTEKRPTVFTHNPAMDGMRGLALCMIMLYHGGIKGISGAVISVDMFLVLSGFLIASLILMAARDNHVDLRKFMIRRARRLIPALLVLLTVVCTWALFMNNMTQRDITHRQAWASLFFVNNWAQISAGDSYFQTFGSPSPLMQTWTLGVEGQFYILYPLLLTMMIRWRWKPLAIIGTTIGLAIASGLLMAALYDPEQDPSRVYFGTDTRIQAPLWGAALAVLVWFFRDRAWVSKPPTVVANVVGVSALALLAVITFTLSEEDPFMFQGMFALAGVAIAGLVWSIVGNRETITYRLLSFKPFVLLGLISYGVYLSHYPLDIVINEASTGITNVWLLLVVRTAAAIGAAMISYFLIERPIRNGALTRMPPLRSWAIKTGSIAGVVALIMASAVPEDVKAESSYNSATVPAAVGGKPEHVVIVGDSNGPALGSQFVPIWAPGWSVDFAFQFGCGPIGGQLTHGGKDFDMGPCNTFYDKRPAILEDMKPTVTLMMLGEWEQFDRVVDGKTYSPDDPEWKADIKGLMKKRLVELHDNNPNLYVVNDGCHSIVNGPTLQFMEVANDIGRVEKVNEALREAAAEMPFEVKYLDLHSFLCPGGFVKERDGKELRSDGMHYSKYGAEVVWKWLYQQVTAQNQLQGTSKDPGQAQVQTAPAQ